MAAMRGPPEADSSDEQNPDLIFGVITRKHAAIALCVLVSYVPQINAIGFMRPLYMATDAAGLPRWLVGWALFFFCPTLSVPWVWRLARFANLPRLTYWEHLKLSVSVGALSYLFAFAMWLSPLTVAVLSSPLVLYVRRRVLRRRRKFKNVGTQH